MEKLSTEVIHKEIDLLQSCINRMASNSFIVKGWMVTLIVAIIALLADKANLVAISGISLVVIFCFWYLVLLCQLGLTRFKLFAINGFRREKGVIFSMESGYGKTLYDQQ